MSAAPVIVEPTQLLRDWARDQDIGGVGARVWAGGLPGDSAVLPALVLHRVGGGGIDVPTEDAMWQWDCWATKASDAANLLGALVTALLNMPYRTLLGTVNGSRLFCHGWTDATLTALYDHSSTNPDRHRYIIPAAQATFTTVPT